MYEKLKSKAVAEVFAYRGLQTQLEGLQEGMDHLHTRQEEMLRRAQEFQDGCLQRLQQLVATLPAQKEALRDMVASLQSLPAQVDESWNKLQAGVVHGLDGADDVSGALCEVLEEQPVQLVQDIATLLGDKFESMQEYVQEDFVEHLRETFTEKFEEICDRCEQVREHVEEGLEQFATDTKELLGDLEKELNEIAGDWGSNLNEVEEACSKLVDRVKDLGRDVSTLTEGVQGALSLTGVGMRAATSTFDDITGVMCGIS